MKTEISKLAGAKAVMTEMAELDAYFYDWNLNGTDLTDSEKLAFISKIVREKLISSEKICYSQQAV